MPLSVSLTESADLPHNDANEVIDEALRFLDTSIISPQHTGLATPPTSSPSRIALPDENQDFPVPPAKRIRFDPHLTLCDDVPTAQSPEEESFNTKLPTHKPQKTLKSILKASEITLEPYSSDVDSNDSPETHATSFFTMLESATQRLTDCERSEKLDAYRFFIEHIRSCTCEEEHEALAEKVPLLEQLIRRDIMAKDTEPQAASRQLASQAIRLVEILLNENCRLNPYLTTAFLQFLFQDTVELLSASRPGKEMAKTQLHLLLSTCLHRRVSTKPSIATSIGQLSSLHSRVDGTAIQVLRLLIFTRFIEQHHQLMLSAIHQWLPIWFHALLSDKAEIRHQAMDFGHRAAAAPGVSKTSSRALVKLLSLHDNNGKSNLSRLKARLLRSLDQGREESLEVPKIWAAIVTFIGEPRLLIKFCTQNSSWLSVLQRCFNAGKEELNINALIAWNRFIVLIDLTKNHPQAVLTILCSPVISILQRRGDSLERLHAAALSTYALILFYGFCPRVADEQLRAVWTTCVDAPIRKLLAKNSSCLRGVCMLMSPLLYVDKTSVWSEKLVSMNSPRPVRLDDLPRIDGHWLRAHDNLVVPTLEYLTKHGLTGPLRQTLREPVYNIWQNTMFSIREASRREIQESSEARRSARSVVGSLLLLLTDASNTVSHSQQVSQVLSFQTVWSLIQLFVDILGPTNLFEPCDVIWKHTNAVTAYHSERPALVLLFQCLSRWLIVHETLPESAHYLDILKKCSQHESSHFSPIFLAAFSMQEIALAHANYHNEALSSLLMSTHELILRQMEAIGTLSQVSDDVLSSLVKSSTFVAHDHKLSVSNMKIWHRVMELTSKAPNADAIIIKIVHQLISNLPHEPSSEWPVRTGNVLSIAFLAIKSSSAVAILGVESMSCQRGHCGDADGNECRSKHLLCLTNHYLGYTYDTYESHFRSSVSQLLSLTRALLQTEDESSGQLLELAIEESLCKWITNEANHMLDATILTELQGIHQSLLEKTDREKISDGSRLQRSERLLIAGLRSKCTAIADATARYWYDTCVPTSGSECSPELQELLLSLKTAANDVPNQFEKDGIEQKPTHTLADQCLSESTGNDAADAPTLRQSSLQITGNTNPTYNEGAATTEQEELITTIGEAVGVPPGPKSRNSPISSPLQSVDENEDDSAWETDSAATDQGNQVSENTENEAGVDRPSAGHEAKDGSGCQTESAATGYEEHVTDNADEEVPVNVLGTGDEESEQPVIRTLSPNIHRPHEKVDTQVGLNAEEPGESVTSPRRLRDQQTKTQEIPNSIASEEDPSVREANQPTAENAAEQPIIEVSPGTCGKRKDAENQQHSSQQSAHEFTQRPTPEVSQSSLNTATKRKHHDQDDEHMSKRRRKTRSSGEIFGANNIPSSAGASRKPTFWEMIEQRENKRREAKKAKKRASQNSQDSSQRSSISHPSVSSQEIRRSSRLSGNEEEAMQIAPAQESQRLASSVRKELVSSDRQLRSSSSRKRVMPSIEVEASSIDASQPQPTDAAAPPLKKRKRTKAPSPEVKETTDKRTEQPTPAKRRSPAPELAIATRTRSSTNASIEFIKSTPITSNKQPTRSSRQTSNTTSSSSSSQPSHKPKTKPKAPLYNFTFTSSPPSTPVPPCPPPSSQPQASQQTPSTSSSTSSASASSPTSATKALAKQFTKTLKDLYQEAKKLFLGAPELREERAELEDALDDVGREIREAGRR